MGNRFSCSLLNYWGDLVTFWPPSLKRLRCPGEGLIEVKCSPFNRLYFSNLSLPLPLSCWEKNCSWRRFIIPIKKKVASWWQSSNEAFMFLNYCQIFKFYNTNYILWNKRRVICCHSPVSTLLNCWCDRFTWNCFRALYGLTFKFLRWGISTWQPAWRPLIREVQVKKTEFLLNRSWVVYDHPCLNFKELYSKWETEALSSLGSSMLQLWMLYSK